MKNILIVGLGSIGKKHIATIKNLYPMATIYVVSSSGSTVSTRIENVEFCQDILQAIKHSLDFAIVASPATFHSIHAQQLLNAKIPVLVEKPITANPQEAKQLIELAKQTKVPMKVAYCLRYLPSAKIIKILLNNNSIGPIYNVQAHVGQYLPTWRKDKNYLESVSASSDLGGGVLLELSHELDYLQWLLGRLTYQFSILRHTQELALEVEEIADIVLTTELGTVCNVHMDFVQKTLQRFCYFYGKQGFIYWDLIGNSVSLHSDNKHEVLYNEPSWDKNNMYFLMIKDFVEQIKIGQVNDESLINASEIVELIECIKKQTVWGVTQ